MRTQELACARSFWHAHVSPILLTHNLACACRLDYAHIWLFMRAHELAQKP